MDDDRSRRVRELQLQLDSLNESLERRLRARGFDPSQIENVALPAPLNQIYLQRQALLEELEELKGYDHPTGTTNHK